MSLDLAKNSVVWDGKKEGFYEAFYIQCNDPVSGMAWWFRYSILVPRKNRGIPYAALWAVQFDQSGARGPIAMKHIYPISHYRSEKDRFILYIEDSFLTNSHSNGKIKHSGRALEWDIQWTPVENNFVHFPSFLYNSPYPRTKVVSPHWATTGGGFIRWNDNEFFLKDALIHVGHVWGTSHSKSWAWSHCHGFQENPMAVFEGLWTPVCGSLGLSMCWFQLGGKLERFTNFGANWQASKFLRDNKWALKLNGSSFKIDGVIEVDTDQVAGITCHDPNGGRRFCYNSKVSKIAIDVFDKATKDSVHLTTPATASFEICTPKELNKFKMLV